jgi:hypothetical protein
MSDPSIHVDLDGLRKFASGVGFYAHEVDPHDVNRSKREFADGVCFGANNASGAVFVAKENYQRALRQSLGNLTEFVAAAQILADAAAKAATDFQAVDGRSAAAIDEVNRNLSEAGHRSDQARHMYGPPVPGTEERL